VLCVVMCRCGNKAAIVDIDEEMNHKIIQVGRGVPHTHTAPQWRGQGVCACVTRAVAGLSACAEASKLPITDTVAVCLRAV
jgi:hypothetical protein